MHSTTNPVVRFPRTIALLLACVPAACTVGPHGREAPDVDLGSDWIAADAERDAPVLDRWWQALGDPLLDQLVQDTLDQNLDLRQAQERIAEARALRDRAAGGRRPTATAQGGVTRREQSLNGPLPIGSIPGVSREQTIYDAGFDARWELDLFGATQHTIDSAAARLQAAEYRAQGARIRIVAETVRSYLSLRGAQQALAVQEAAASVQESLRDTQARRMAAGVSPRAELDQAQAALDAARAELPALQAQQRNAMLQLSLLLGRPPEAALPYEQQAAPPVALQSMPVGQRAELLRRRPDVRAAERQLAASTADIGVATAELFPKLSIGAGGGFQSLASGQWLDAGSRYASITPLIAWRVFDGGRIRAEIRAAEARERQAALAYEQAVLAALGDAEQGLSNYQLGLSALQRREAALAAAQRGFRHASHRYDAGDIDRAELLNSALSLHQAEFAQARSHTEAALRWVALCKALGGGWPNDA